MICLRRKTPINPTLFSRTCLFRLNKWRMSTLPPWGMYTSVSSRQWSPGLPFFCQHTYGINTLLKKALMLIKLGQKEVILLKSTPLKRIRLFICSYNAIKLPWKCQPTYHYFIYILPCGFLFWWFLKFLWFPSRSTYSCKK